MGREKIYKKNQLKSSFKIVELSSCLIEQNNKIKPFDFPEQDFAILGVDNKVGIFDAYIAKGKEINQPYKKMENGFIAYNPYRVNVGSIGLKKVEHKHNYISPAYVVFSCQDNLMPDFLFLVFKSSFYNQIIKENTTGSVRQNLSFDNLGKLEIPLPDLPTQKKLVNAYQNKMAKADNLEKQANQNFSGCLDQILGINSEQNEYPKSKLIFVHSKDIDKWGGIKLLILIQIFQIYIRLKLFKNYVKLEVVEHQIEVNLNIIKAQSLGLRLERWLMMLF